jgi:hypothetical protein
MVVGGGIRNDDTFVDKSDNKYREIQEGNFIQVVKLKKLKMLVTSQMVTHKKKFRNVDVRGVQGSDKTGDFSDLIFDISV